MAQVFDNLLRRFSELLEDAADHRRRSTTARDAVNNNAIPPREVLSNGYGDFAYRAFLVVPDWTCRRIALDSAVAKTFGHKANLRRYRIAPSGQVEDPLDTRLFQTPPLEVGPSCEVTGAGEPAPDG